MKLGFVSAILPDLDLEEVLQFAGTEGFLADSNRLRCHGSIKKDTAHFGLEFIIAFLPPNPKPVNIFNFEFGA